MKKSLQLFIAALFLSLPLFAQNFYTVQVGTFLDARPADFEALDPLGFVHATKLEGNLYQVYLSGFDDRAEAAALLPKVKDRGYTNAFIKESNPVDGQRATVIQLSLQSSVKPVDWQKYLDVGALYVIINGDKLKITTGLYPSVNAAKRDLAAIRNQGFRDAFIKNVNTIFLHRVGDFETGNLQRGLVPLSQSGRVSSNTQPTGYGAYGGRINTGDNFTTKAPDSRPRSYDYSLSTPSSFGTPTPTFTRAKAGAAGSSYPEINPRIKRKSALELQKILKAAGTYTSTLDGLYGNGTAKAYEAFKNNNRSYQKYLLLARFGSGLGLSGEAAQLQNAINNLLVDQSAQDYVQTTNHPLAQAYRAYLYFVAVGPGQEVNRFMNDAIRDAYRGKSLSSPPPLDYRNTYAYDNLQQLILHIHYIHSAPDINIAVPCWLFQEHPAETGYAYETYARFANPDYPLQGCDQFLQWEEVGALQAIAMDLNSSTRLDNSLLASAAAHRARLYVAPEKLTTMERQTLDAWYSRLMSGLNAWSRQDPLHQSVARSFDVAFHQSQVLLEDFYMDRNFNAEEAKGLALATLHTVVAYHLERFVR